MGFWHGLYDMTLRNELEENNCTFENLEWENPSDKCIELLNTFDSYTTDINVYDVYRKCYGLDEFELYEGDKFAMV